MTLYRCVTAGLAALFLLLAQSLMVSAADWTVDNASSSLTFEATVFGSSVPGSFEAWTADISFDADALETSSVSVTIEMSSATTDDAARDGSLKGPEWFAVDDHPQATLTSTAFRATGDQSFEMDADLTLRGVTQSVSLPFTLEETGDGQVRASGTVTIDRTDFGVGQGDFVTGSTVALTVPISIDVVATAQPSTP